MVMCPSCGLKARQETRLPEVFTIARLDSDEELIERYYRYRCPSCGCRFKVTVRFHAKVEMISGEYM